MASMPIRNKEESGYISDDDAVPRNNPTTTTELLGERLQAWKHMCGYLENYISEIAKDQKSQAKDQEKILKHISHPLREAHHFEQSTGGVSALFENLRANTNAQASLHAETSQNLTKSVLPILERLHSEIKGKAKELDKGAGKGTKAVETARNHSQKHIELLGQHTAGFDSTGGKITAANDPYVLQRQVDHRLHKQLLEENNSRDELIGVQNSFAQFEAHVLQTVQTALAQFNQYMSGQADRQRAMYGDIAGNAGRIPPDFEWRGFMNRSGDKLIDPNAPKRSMSSISYPNQNHRSTQPIIEGTLERKGKGLSALSGYSSNHYAITPSGFLHEYKDSDNYRHDPSPETSLYLPDCVVGALDGVKFAVKGKDTSGGKLSQKMSSTSDYTFKAHTPQEAAKWHEIITAQTSGATSSLPNSPTSPVQHRAEPINTQAAAAPVAQPGVQQHGIIGQEPYSATSQHAPQYNAAEPYSAGQPAPLNTGVAAQQGTGYAPHSAGGTANPNVKY